MNGRLIELDGLRGLAAFAVVIAHYFGETASGLKNLQFGWLGVEAFFVLSGFLIGGIIFDEIGRPGFWKSFYVRRSARILPLYLVAVAIVVAMGAAFGPLTYLTFTQNFAAAAEGGMDTIVAQPLWTLAVEEQFYLLLPIIVLVTPRRFILTVLLAIIAAAPIFRAFTVTSEPVAATITLFGRMDMLGAGVLAAWALRNLDLKPYLLAIRIAPIPLLFATSALNFLVGLEAFVVIGQTTLAFGIAAFILALALGAPEGRGLFRLPVLRFFGAISYGLYLLHQPINWLLHEMAFGAAPDVATAPQVLVSLVSVAVSILVAWGSWNLFESRIIASARDYLKGRPVFTRTPAFSAS